MLRIYNLSRGLQKVNIILYTFPYAEKKDKGKVNRARVFAHEHYN